MGYASNTKIIWASKLLIGIGNFNTKYNPSKIYNNFKQSESNNNNNSIKKELELKTAFATYSADNNFDNYYILCLANKQMQIINQSKPRIKVSEKHEEVYVNLWGLYNPFLLLKKNMRP